jgi:hypothetical protein
MRLNVYGKQYRVLKSKTDDKTDAEVDFDAQLITVKEDQVGDTYMHSVIHELIHCIFNRISLNQTAVKDDLEEIICDNIATVMIENFVITPKMKEYE